MYSTHQLVQQIKSAGQDYEFYPSTNEIIQAVKADIDKHFGGYPSVLDCGAGDGRVLNALTEGKKYAIEKSVPLLNALNKDIFVVGTEFNDQTLMDKKTDILYSNPPFSVFEEWAVKIITEANAQCIYLVLPKRWKNSLAISAAIEARKGESSVIDKFDFLDAERAARTEVHLVKVELRMVSRHFSCARPTVDPFRLWFEKHFKIEISKKEKPTYQQKIDTVKELNERVSTELIEEQDLISMLSKFYQQDLEKLLATYQGLSNVDPDILKELNVNLDGVREALELKIASLKDVYWNELFNRLSNVTDRLTTSSRKALLETLTEHTHVDFSISNAHAVLIWIIKNASDQFDSQLLETFEKLISKSNLITYKSNQRTFRNDEWRYRSKPDGLDRYGLDYRIVLENCGGLHDHGSWSDHVNGLSLRAANLINDLCTVAANVGFDTKGTSRANSFEWSSSAKKTFEYRDIDTHEVHTLFDVRAFKNGNMHFRFNQNLICKLNVEFGRLKGWLRTSQQAADELDIDIDVAEKSFGTNLRLTGTSSLLQLGLNIAA